MKWKRTFTDDEVVERVRWFERNRKKIALLMILMGLTSIGGGVYGVLYLMQRWEPVAIEAKASPADAEIREDVDHLTFVVGVVAGFVFGKLVVTGAMTASYGLMLILVTDRRNQLLLEFWDRGNSPMRG